MSEVLVPVTGELVPLDDPVKVAETLDDLFELERQIKDAKRMLVDALEPLSAELGTRTLELGDIQVVLTSDTKTEYDLVKLADLLTEAGLPEQRLADLIAPTVTYKLNHSVARQLRGANPKYAEALDRCRTEVPATVYAKVKRRRNG